MLISLLTYFFISNALTMRKDKSILFSRIKMISLIILYILFIYHFIILPINEVKDITIYGNLLLVEPCCVYLCICIGIYLYPSKRYIFSYALNFTSNNKASDLSDEQCGIQQCSMLLNFFMSFPLVLLVLYYLITLLACLIIVFINIICSIIFIYVCLHIITTYVYLFVGVISNNLYRMCRTLFTAVTIRASVYLMQYLSPWIKLLLPCSVHEQLDILLVDNVSILVIALVLMATVFSINTLGSLPYPVLNKNLTSTKLITVCFSLGFGYLCLNTLLSLDVTKNTINACLNSILVIFTPHTLNIFILEYALLITPYESDYIRTFGVGSSANQPTGPPRPPTPNGPETLIVVDESEDSDSEAKSSSLDIASLNWSANYTQKSPNFEYHKSLLKVSNSFNPELVTNQLSFTQNIINDTGLYTDLPGFSNISSIQLPRVSKLEDLLKRGYGYNNHKMLLPGSNRQYSIINLEKGLFMPHTMANDYVYKQVVDNMAELKGVLSYEYMPINKYYKAYFENTDCISCFDKWKVKDNQINSTRLAIATMENYMSHKQGFNIKHYSSSISATWSAYTERPQGLLHQSKTFYITHRNLKTNHCMVDVSYKDDWIESFNNLKALHTNNNKNTNCFSVIFSKTRVAFFIYIDGWHVTNAYLNKGSDWSNFLALYTSKDGVEILPQRNIYAPQLVFYDIYSDNVHDRYSAHVILRYMSTLHGVPRVGGNNLMLSQLEYSRNPSKHTQKIGSFDDNSKVKVLYNGKFTKIQDIKKNV